MKLNLPTPNDTPAGGMEQTSFFASAVTAWNRFWFTPADPTILGVIRIGCGLLALYTLLVYTFDFQILFGPDAYYNLDLRREYALESPFVAPPLDWPATQPYGSLTLTDAQQAYVTYYKERWNENPPLPFPRDLEKSYQLAREALGREPTSMAEIVRFNPDASYYDAYRAKWGSDPRQAVAIGTRDWSVWFHITDPTAMAVVHALFILVTLLFTIGFATRLTSVLAWFAAVNYIHRAPTTLFGVDTMMLITMIYCMIGPSGAALSVDRLLGRWWRSRGRGGVPLFSFDDKPPAPSVSANLAIRLLQVHMCFIYAAAGLAKLKGAAWWQGMAIWGTIANTEFAPMQTSLYMQVLYLICMNETVLYVFLIFGTYFTLFFEICYPFLVWNRRTRWVILSMAVVLHGFIGLLMGLRTFAYMMLVMNLIFVPAPLIHGLINHSRAALRRLLGPSPLPSESLLPEAATAVAGRTAAGHDVPASAHSEKLQRKNRPV